MMDLITSGDFWTGIAVCYLSLAVVEGWMINRWLRGNRRDRLIVRLAVAFFGGVTWPRRFFDTVQ